MVEWWNGGMNILLFFVLCFYSSVGVQYSYRGRKGLPVALAFFAFLSGGTIFLEGGKG